VTDSLNGGYFDRNLLDPGIAAERFSEVRARTARLAEPISAGDAQVQTMPDVSPTKWHLAHTTWLFETFILKQFVSDHPPYDERFHYLFNSYYEAEGARHPRPERGAIARPDLDQVNAYRAHTERLVMEFLETAANRNDWSEIAALIDLGCHHEEQHQELLLSDIKHVLAQNPNWPAYQEKDPEPPAAGASREAGWADFSGGLLEVGHDGDGFAFDCEGPRHKVYLEDFTLATQLVTNGEYLEFIEDGGYARPEFWLSDGWATVGAEGWHHPLYWRKNGSWTEFALDGERPLNPEIPVSHVSLFEADAFAAWAGARLPREEELEIAAFSCPPKAPTNDLENGALHPTAAPDGTGVKQLYGDLWEWTQSAYSPYPRFKARRDALGEYNGKFMCNQYVLKGGSCATPRGHCRASYRNFFPPHSRWQFTGLRLARD
jgi:ergothioneine biosynthesis protein EgtB